jgi:uncharacterized ubiquitin-like protein YukD
MAINFFRKYPKNIITFAEKTKKPFIRFPSKEEDKKEVKDELARKKYNTSLQPIDLDIYASSACRKLIKQYDNLKDDSAFKLSDAEKEQLKVDNRDKLLKNKYA